MPLSTRDFNNFAMALTDDIRNRAMGLSPDSERIIKSSPMDYILTGFLTPLVDNTPRTATSEEQVDNELENDLPSDSPYEQSSIGIEWLSSIAEIGHLQDFSMSVSLAIYTRVIPTFSEQMQHMGGRTFNKSHDGYVVPMVPVWEMIDLGQFEVAVDVQKLLQERKTTVELRKLCFRRLRETLSRRFFPRKSDINIPIQYMENEETYDSFLKQINMEMIDLNWAPTLDMRVSSMPSRPELVRFSIRMINETVRPENKHFVYCDPNLYRANMSITIPKSVWVPMVFRELPKSYRYNREYHALGINCNAEVHEQDSWMTFVTQPVPIKEVPRIEPRRIPDASPSFVDLMTDPIPCLNRILSAMKEFDEKDWDDKIRSLSNDEERQEAVRDRQDFRRQEISPRISTVLSSFN